VNCGESVEVRAKYRKPDIPVKTGQMKFEVFLVLFERPAQVENNSGNFCRTDRFYLSLLLQ
tara:strand:+ start:478 stop:660 length:183 start_codon:yes stop_codon:yes gene_type:complete